MSPFRYFYVPEFERVVRRQGDCAWTWEEGEWQRNDAWAEVIGVGTDPSASEEITENEAVRRGATVSREQRVAAPPPRIERSDPSDVEILCVHEGGGLVRYPDNTLDEPIPRERNFESDSPSAAQRPRPTNSPVARRDSEGERGVAPQGRDAAREQHLGASPSGERALTARRYLAHLLASLVATCGMLVVVLFAPTALPRLVTLGLMFGAGIYYVGAFLIAAAFVWGRGWALAALLFVGFVNRSGGLLVLIGVVPLVVLLWQLRLVARAGGIARNARLPRDLRLRDVLSKKSIVEVTSCEERSAILELLPALVTGVANDEAATVLQRLAGLVNEKERIFSTSRDGIAVVTLMTRDATPLLAAIGRSREGVQLQDGGVAHLLFVTTEMVEHADRRWNARLIWVLTRPGVRAQLRTARTPTQLLRILGRAEKGWR